MKGLFQITEFVASKAPPSMIPKCGACGLFKICNSPKMPVSGKGEKGILIVAEAPGKDEDRQGIQLVGEAGQLLERTLRSIGISMRKDCWLTNTLICRPPNNATPTSDQIAWCRPNLIKTIKELKPKVIIPLGAAACESLIGYVWKEDSTFTMTKWAGWKIPLQKHNTWVCPTYHPSFLLRSQRGEFGRTGNPILETLFKQHLRQATGLKSRPWKEIPDYAEEVEPIFEADKAAKIIRKMIKKGGRVAFDYETNMLKPDNKAAEIVTCSVCWEGIKTIAYPWMGEAITATKELLLSDLGKIASNKKFETRWSRCKLGIWVRRWIWDTMINSHIIDQREGITSIKFQAFVLLGQPDWDSHIKPYLQAEGSQTPNRIKEVDLRSLLIYNGLDSLLEFKVAELQAEHLGVELC